MFLEPQWTPHPQTGWIEVICGSMFSGKTEELIRRVNRALIAKQEVKIFKPALDKRYDEIKVVSHDRNHVHAYPVENAYQMLSLVENCQVVAIDEAQFFDNHIVEVCNTLAFRGIRVIVSGLDMDFQGKPFGVMPHLIAIAEFVTKVHAICVCCGGLASYSFRLSPSKKQVLLGEKDIYEPRCRYCYYKAMFPEMVLEQEKSY
ncbi:thymidine kinase [Thermoflexibacter ruber]|uniref:Thymidine kinase n=1 Tax=Thermoflexibacter ruber TaxID=1003 RepID=A0A1I2J0S1_9BACT|nr:thymidine kinase [Thermoflexibacter ruber]SFF46341.1 thymidine kinase [Thermoflexibacter ruber]